MGQKTANVTPIFSMELQNKLRFFAIFLFDYSGVTLFTPVTPIFFVFFFLNFMGGYKYTRYQRHRLPPKTKMRA